MVDGDDPAVFLCIFPDDRQRPVVRAVVDHVYLLHEVGDGIECLADEEFLVVCRNDHGDATVPVSRSGYGKRFFVKNRFDIHLPGDLLQPGRADLWPCGSRSLLHQLLCLHQPYRRVRPDRLAEARVVGDQRIDAARASPRFREVSGRFRVLIVRRDSSSWRTQCLVR